MSIETTLPEATLASLDRIAQVLVVSGIGSDPVMREVIAAIADGVPVEDEAATPEDCAASTRLIVEMLADRVAAITAAGAYQTPRAVQ